MAWRHPGEKPLSEPVMVNVLSHGLNQPRPHNQKAINHVHTVYPKKYAHGFVVLCFVVVMQSFIMNSHEVFIHIHQGCFAGTGAIVRLPQCQWSEPDGYGKISQCITTTKHSKAKTVCIFLGIYCILGHGESYFHCNMAERQLGYHKVIITSLKWYTRASALTHKPVYRYYDFPKSMPGSDENNFNCYRKCMR